MADTVGKIDLGEDCFKKTVPSDVRGILKSSKTSSDHAGSVNSEEKKKTVSDSRGILKAESMADQHTKSDVSDGRGILKAEKKENLLCVRSKSPKSTAPLFVKTSGPKSGQKSVSYLDDHVAASGAKKTSYLDDQKENSADDQPKV